MLVNAWRLKYKKKTKRKERPIEYQQYFDRNARLSELGYRSYAEYLQSEDWKKIRNEVLEQTPTCVACANVACQVHHLNYSNRVLLGIAREYLVPICRGCHEAIEIDDGEKRSLPAANTILVELVGLNKGSRDRGRINSLIQAAYQLFNETKTKVSKRKSSHFRIFDNREMCRRRKQMFGVNDSKLVAMSPSLVLTADHVAKARGNSSKFTPQQYAALRINKMDPSAVTEAIGAVFTEAEISAFVKYSKQGVIEARLEHNSVGCNSSRIFGHFRIV